MGRICKICLIGEYTRQVCMRNRRNMEKAKTVKQKYQISNPMLTQCFEGRGVSSKRVNGSQFIGEGRKFMRIWSLRKRGCYFTDT